MDYQSYKVVHSKKYPGVSLKVRRISFGRRLELLRQVREAAAKAEYLGASEDPREKLEASLLACELDRLYLLWGLEGIEGLEVDGRPATPESLVEAGPEGLCGEALQAIKAEFGLSEDEEKN